MLLSNISEKSIGESGGERGEVSGLSLRIYKSLHGFKYIEVLYE